MRDKLLLGLMYATGVRVSEVVRLRRRDFDFDRRTVTVWQGKGRKDRVVMLPHSFAPLLRRLGFASRPDDYLFASCKHNRHLSPTTVQRVMARAVAIASIGKRATPHSLRHSFATHLNLDTRAPVGRPAEAPLPVGRMRIDLRRVAAGSAAATLTILSDTAPVKLEGVVVKELRPGWVTIDVPPLEAWETALRWLTPPQRERIADARFYVMLQAELARRYARLGSEK